MAKAKSVENTVTTSSTEPTLKKTSNESDNSVNTSANSTSQRIETGAVVDKVDSSSNNENISISSIHEDDRGNDSSAFESSESECDDEEIKRAIDRIPQTLQPGSQLVQNGMLTVNGNNGSPGSSRGPNIGSIAVQNSSDITFGNKTYIKGQVVIKNIYHDNQKNGAINQGYQESDGELGAKNVGKDQPVTINPVPSWKTSLKTIVKEKPILVVIILVAVMVIITSSVIAVILSGKGRLQAPHYGDGDDDRTNVPPDTGIDKDLLPGEKPLRIVSRLEWLAQPARGELDPLKLPVSQVIIAHTATEGCNTQSACSYRIRFMQVKHMETDNYSDIAYNFMIGGDGEVYEGRGWKKVGAFLRGQNAISEGIAFVGHYSRMNATEAQMEKLDALLRKGVSEGYLSKNYKLYGARTWKNTESPGDLLFERLKNHSHFSDSRAECVFITSKIQDFHMANDSKNFFDIGYNFLVGGDGNAYEGRGWDKVGAHTLGYNNDSICIAFIGTFTDHVPPASQLGAAKQLIGLGLQLGKLSKRYSLYGHRQLAPFESPGKKLYEIIQTWPHWSNTLAPGHWRDPDVTTSQPELI
ncbi:peptidoglycan recognition protein 3-like [Uranotaenia lowii]|uniref:peptidoglycan recognition protein 3-like n=1 Tax=Uranotaenia lowii TaxID=190385 RepID=UPI002479E2CA|nr:peptidoglycan recognition protein 3-like [Uranotaenia lowii]